MANSTARCPSPPEGACAERAPRRVALLLGAAVWPGGVASPALARRTAHAAELIRRHEVDLVFASGGRGRHPPSEAVVMRRLLEEAGVPPERIRLDEKARTTMASAENVAAWLARADVSAELVVVTDRYHGPRVRLALWGVGLRARVAAPPAGLSVRARLRAWRREAVGLPVYAVRVVFRHLFRS